MLLFRIASAKRIGDLTGEGARLYGGRWNPRDVAVLYTSESRALATVEYLVHAALAHAPAGLRIATLEAPADLAIEHVEADSLPRNWRAHPGPPSLVKLGGAWIASGRTPLLRVPSAVVSGEYNVLVNPAHPDAARIRLAAVEPCRLDERLFTPSRRRAP